jgi:hypothetical protein
MGVPMGTYPQPGYTPQTGFNVPMGNYPQPGYTPQDGFNIHSQLNQVLQRQDLLLESARKQEQDRLISTINSSVATQSRYAAALSKTSNQQPSPF